MGRFAIPDAEQRRLVSLLHPLLSRGPEEYRNPARSFYGHHKILNLGGGCHILCKHSDKVSACFVGSKACRGSGRIVLDRGVGGSILGFVLIPIQNRTVCVGGYTLEGDLSAFGHRGCTDGGFVGKGGTAVVDAHGFEHLGNRALFVLYSDADIVYPHGRGLDGNRSGVGIALLGCPGGSGRLLVVHCILPGTGSAGSGALDGKGAAFHHRGSGQGGSVEG